MFGSKTLARHALANSVVFVGTSPPTKSFNFHGEPRPFVTTQPLGGTHQKLNINTDDFFFASFGPALHPIHLGRSQTSDSLHRMFCFSNSKNSTTPLPPSFNLDPAREARYGGRPPYWGAGGHSFPLVTFYYEDGYYTRLGLHNCHDDDLMRLKGSIKNMCFIHMKQHSHV